MKAHVLTDPTPAPRRFRQFLQEELAKRCARNPRYSLRAFARYSGSIIRRSRSSCEAVAGSRREPSPTMRWATGQRTPDRIAEINGGVWPIGPTEGHPLVQLFVEVDDVSTYAAKVQQLGGQILIPPQTLPDGDQLAIVLDTEGLSLA